MPTPSALRKPVRKTRIWDRTLEAQKRRSGLIFALPAFLFFGFFYIYPLFSTFQVSLYSWSLLSTPEFLGMNNYDVSFRIGSSSIRCG
ncbi:MAG: hypothetical protein R2873_26445 [Caldilineaceae bacterium]